MKPLKKKSDCLNEHSDKVRKEKLEKFKTECHTFLSAKDIMSPCVSSIDQDSTIFDAVGLFSKEKISAVIVIDSKNKPVGVFSETDLVRFEREHSGHLKKPGAIYSEADIHDYFDHIQEGIEGVTVYDKKVMNYMTTHIITVEPYDGISHCCKVMRDKDVHRVFVKDHDEIIGVISTTDIVTAFAN